MKGINGKSIWGFVSLRLAFSTGVLFLTILNSLAGVRVPEARNLTMAIYPDNSLQSAATLKFARVHTDHRHVGFFSVKVLPILVGEGVRLELASETPNTNWLASLSANPIPAARHAGVEWRECSVWLPHDSAARLSAERLVLKEDDAATEFCSLEGVTVQTDSGPLKIPRARLLLGAEAGLVRWQQDGHTVTWDLFSKKITAGNSN